MDDNGKNTGANAEASVGPFYRVGDLVNCPPETYGDPKWDYGLVIDVKIIGEYFFYVVFWAVDGETTTESEGWMGRYTELIKRGTREQP